MRPRSLRGWAVSRELPKVAEAEEHCRAGAPSVKHLRAIESRWRSGAEAVSMEL